MNESFLYYVWKYRLFNDQQLTTTAGEKVRIIQPGVQNHSSGPDFDMATIVVDDLKWVGRVELHLRTSDWFRHKHQDNSDYEQLILHVVWEHDSDEEPNNIPILELKGRVSNSLLERYKNFQEGYKRIPCEPFHQEIDDLALRSWLERMLIERLLARTAVHKLWLSQTKNNWDEVAYRSLLQSFGMKYNKTAFEQLAIQLPYKVIAANANNLDLVRALLIGVAGLEKNYQEPDYESLIMNWTHLKTKYRLVSIPPTMWKFGRIRPHNQPLVRLEQLTLMLTNKSLLAFWKDQLMVKTAKPEQQNFFSVEQQKQLSKEFQTHVLINGILPVLFSYAHEHGLEELKTACIDKFFKLKAEKNNIIKIWKSLPLKSWSAGETQALMQLTANYCDLKKCLSCTIGRTVLVN